MPNLETRFRTDVLPLKDKFFRLALRITLERAEAEDITQETLIRMWERREEWATIQSLEAWGLTICRNFALDHTRKAQFRAANEQDLLTSSLHNSQLSPLNSQLSTVISPDEQLDQKQRVEAVRQLIDQLPEVQRTIIQLRDIEGMRYDEIAQATDLSETQVKVYLHRARKKIRDLFNP